MQLIFLMTLMRSFPCHAYDIDNTLSPWYWQGYFPMILTKPFLYDIDNAISLSFPCHAYDIDNTLFPWYWQDCFPMILTKPFPHDIDKTLFPWYCQGYLTSFIVYYKKNYIYILADISWWTCFQINTLFPWHWQELFPMTLTWPFPHYIDKVSPHAIDQALSPWSWQGPFPMALTRPFPHDIDQALSSWYWQGPFPMTLTRPFLQTLTRPFPQTLTRPFSAQQFVFYLILMVAFQCSTSIQGWLCEVTTELKVESFGPWNQRYTSRLCWHHHEDQQEKWQGITSSNLLIGTYI